MRIESTSHSHLTLYARRVMMLAGVVLVLLLLGATGLSLSEGVSFWYAFQWALDTAATVGGFPEPRSSVGQVVEVLLVLLGVGTLFYALATVAELFVAGHVAELLAFRRTQRMIDSLRDHHIVCGFGRVGQQVVRDLLAAGAACVIIDTHSRYSAVADELHSSFIEGDATEDSVLTKAGIAHARSIVACADSDANNVFITLSARELRADIAIVARAANEDTEKKLRRAGANRVISPYKASGTEMARLALHRQVSGVVEVAADYRLEEIEVGAGCAAVSRTIEEIGDGSTIVGLRRGSEFRPQPDAATALEPLDIVVAVGTPPALERLVSALEERRA